MKIDVEKKSYRIIQLHYINEMPTKENTHREKNFAATQNIIERMQVKTC